MTQLPAVTGKDIVRALRKAGFVVIRTVPVHAGKTLKRGTLHGIIKQAGFTVDEFIALL